jgi:hypothetical protein
MNQHPGSIGNVNRSDTDMQMGYIFAGSILQGFLLAYILVKANISSVAGGFITGAIIGFLIAASFDLTMYGTTYIMSKKAINGRHNSRHITFGHSERRNCFCNK